MLELVGMALAGIVGNRADAVVMRLFADPSWKAHARDLVNRMEGVKVDSDGFDAWLEDPSVAELVAAYRTEEPPDEVVEALVAGLDRHGALPNGTMVDGEWAALAEEVVLSALLAVPGAASDELRALLRETQALRDGQWTILDELYNQRDTVDRIDSGVQELLARTPPAVPTQVFSDLVPDLPGLFVGRDQLLDQLAVSPPGAGVGVKVLTQTIEGMGGVGKSTVAAAHAHRSRDGCEVVWWVRAATEATLIGDLAALAPLVGVPAHDDVNDTAAAVRRWFEHTDRRWLAVFDNAADRHLLETWRPKRGNGTVIVTTRDRNLAVGDVIPVDKFPPDVAEAFLRDRTRPRNPAASDEPAVADVVARLDGLPLALEQAAAWAAYSPTRRYARYVLLFDDIAAEPFPDDTRPAGYDLTAATTWRISIDAATEITPAARAVMAVLGFYAPEQIPGHYLRDAAADPHLGTDPAGIDAAYDALHNHSLIQLAAADTISVHRVVQAAARRTANAETGGCVIRALTTQVPADVTSPGSWPDLARLDPHVVAALPYLTGGTQDDEIPRWSFVLDRIAMYRQYSGATRQAIPLFEAALDLDRTHRGEDHPGTLTAWANLALSYWSAGRTGDAVQIGERVAAKRGEILGEDHPDTLKAWANLASSYWSAGRTGDAVQIEERVAAKRGEILGEDHPDTLKAWANLASSYWSAGRTGDAVQIGERVAAKSVEILGEDHPETLTAWANLASSYWSAGRTGDAVQILERVAAKRVEILGEDHPSTLTAWANLASSYWSAGRTGDAVQIGERVAAKRGEILGEDHPDTLTAWANLASSYWSAGRTGDAVQIGERVAAKRGEILGEDHPDTLTAWANLASSYWSAGRTGDAVQIGERVAAKRVEILGEDHPDTLTAWANLASSYWSAGRTGDAVQIGERVAAKRVEILGEDHPDTLKAWANLALSYRSAGRTGDAVQILERVAAKRGEILGEDHPDTLKAWANLALSYRSAGRTGDAVQIEERVAAKSVEILGEDHPDTLISRHNLAGSLRQIGRRDEAAALAADVLARAERVLPDAHPLWGPLRDLVTELTGHDE